MVYHFFERITKYEPELKKSLTAIDNPIIKNILPALDGYFLIYSSNIGLELFF